MTGKSNETRLYRELLLVEMKQTSLMNMISELCIENLRMSRLQQDLALVTNVKVYSHDL